MNVLSFIINFLIALQTKGVWVTRRKEKVELRNILKTLKATVTTCHHRCLNEAACTKYGTKDLVNLGIETTCFLVKTDTQKYSRKMDETMDLFVIEMFYLIII